MHIFYVDNNNMALVVLVLVHRTWLIDSTVYRKYEFCAA